MVNQLLEFNIVPAGAVDIETGLVRTLPTFNPELARLAAWDPTRRIVWGQVASVRRRLWCAYARA
jgi:hypothetical protein